MKHTPGEWFVYEHDPLVIVNSDGSSLGEMRPGDPFISLREALANARVAAAATRLLAVCQAIEAHCRNEQGLKGAAHAEEGKKLREQMRAAISKATA